MNWNTLLEIKKYLQGVKPLFIEWSIRLISEWWNVKITYKDSFLDFTIKEKLPYGDKEAVNKVVDFCFNCYFDYEWKGQAFNSEILWKLLNLKPVGVRTILHKIYNKLGVYGKPILQEK